MYPYSLSLQCFFPLFLLPRSRSRLNRCNSTSTSLLPFLLPSIIMLFLAILLLSSQAIGADFRLLYQKPSNLTMLEFNVRSHNCRYGTVREGELEADLLSSASSSSRQSSWYEQCPLWDQSNMAQLGLTWSGTTFEVGDFSGRNNESESKALFLPVVFLLLSLITGIPVSPSLHFLLRYSSSL